MRLHPVIELVKLLLEKCISSCLSWPNTATSWDPLTTELNTVKSSTLSKNLKIKKRTIKMCSLILNSGAVRHKVGDFACACLHLSFFGKNYRQRLL
jgi:hypothetical protein